MDIITMLENAHENYAQSLMAEVNAARSWQENKAAVAEVEERLLAHIAETNNDRQFKQLLAATYNSDEELSNARLSLEEAQHLYLAAEAERKAAYDWTLMVRAFVSAENIQYKDQTVMMRE